jgi:hypothetical protein
MLRYDARMTKTLALGVLLAIAACGNKKSGECRATSVGACAPGGSCGATIACGDKAYEIKCTSPTAADAKQVDCQCVEGGVIGKTVQLEFPLNAKPDAVKSACGWK